MRLYYYHDLSAHEQRNAAGADYTPAYLPVMLKNSGFSAQELTAEALLRYRPEEGDALLIGAEALTASQCQALAAAAEDGCAVIAFAAKAPGLFPDFVSEKQSGDDYDIVGYFHFSDTEELLPVLGGFGSLPETGGEVLGWLKDREGGSHAALIRLRKGIWYWSFDLPATLWHAADGRPTLELCNGFSKPRIPDGYVLGQEDNYAVPYADSYMRAVEDLLVSRGFPRLYPLPVHNENVCDLALYFAGDDDATSEENDMAAAEAMFQRGLPYHLNLMPVDEEGRFRISREQLEQLHAQGCETALHYNFLMFPYSEEGYKLQSDMYEQAFGEVSIGPVNHCLIQVGTAGERYRIEAACGALGDNNRLQAQMDPQDINAFNLSGFASGTAFPRFVLCDAAHGNRELDFCEVYSSFYEPRLYTEEPEECRKIEDYLEDGFAYGRPLQLFLHPHYISGVWCDPLPALKALDHATDYVRKKGWNVWTCGPDALIHWWHDRAACQVASLSSREFTVNNPTDWGITVVLPEDTQSVTVDNQPGALQTKTVAGKQCKLLNLGSGTFRVSCN